MQQPSTSSSVLKRLLWSGALSVLGLVAQAPAQAMIVSTTQTTYHFTGNCTDCAALSGTASHEVSADLTLNNYTEGTPLGASNFVSLIYAGSNLLDPYVVSNLTLEDLSGLPVTHGFFGSISGSLVTGGAQSLRIDFGDGLAFSLASDGSWFTCGAKDGVYYAQSCTSLLNNDTGLGGVFTPSAVPEPETAVLLPVGLAALAMLQRRQRKAGTAAARG